MKVLVFGFYDKGNLGDELFKEAFKKIFPELDFTFTDKLTKELLKSFQVIFIGGGSFLDQSQGFSIDDLSGKDIFYIGIGAETNINPIHEEIIKKAKLVAIRTYHYQKISKLNTSVMIIPDLVYALYNHSGSSYRNKSILVIPNVLNVPVYSDPHWKHVAWDFYKNELAQVLDERIRAGYTINFFPMAEGLSTNDSWAAIEIMNRMQKKSSTYLLNSKFTSKEVISLFSEYQVIISQRYHGNIIAELANRPYLGIWHHDKLKSSYFNKGEFIPYFEVSKNKISQKIDELSKKKQDQLVINLDIFGELKHKIYKKLGL